MRRWLTLLLGVPALLVAADVIAWQMATARMRAEVQTQAAGLRAGGWLVRWSNPERSGFPWAATLALSDVRIEGGASALPGGLAWSADRLVLSIAWTDPWHVSISPQGEETLRISHAPPVAFAADTLQARLPLGGGRPDHAEVTATAVTGGLQQSRRRQDVRIGALSVRLQVQPGVSGGVHAGLAFSATDIGLPDKGRWPLGGAVSSFSAAVMLASPPVSGADSRAQVQSWRDGGGEVGVQALDLHWGPLSLQGDAKLGLDAAFQPAGTGHVRVRGIGPALDALAAAEVIGPGIAVTYKAVLGLMASDASSAIDLPLTLRDSTLSLGQIPLAQFKALVWR
jgi:hypothetical protein